MATPGIKLCGNFDSRAAIHPVDPSSLGKKPGRRRQKFVKQIGKSISVTFPFAPAPGRSLFWFAAVSFSFLPGAVFLCRAMCNTSTCLSLPLTYRRSVHVSQAEAAWKADSNRRRLRRPDGPWPGLSRNRKMPIAHSVGFSWLRDWPPADGSSGERQKRKQYQYNQQRERERERTQRVHGL